MSVGIVLITRERERQIREERWTPEHDDGHTLGEMAAAGACYALLGTRWRDAAVLGSPLVRSILWPWDDEWFKPTDYPDPPYHANVHIDRHVRDLVKAGALIAAEIDRLERVASRPAADTADTNCTGADDCAVAVHVHGCFADDGNCDEPDEHEWPDPVPVDAPPEPTT